MGGRHSSENKAGIQVFLAISASCKQSNRAQSDTRAGFAYAQQGALAAINPPVNPARTLAAGQVDRLPVQKARRLCLIQVKSWQSLEQAVQGQQPGQPAFAVKGLEVIQRHRLIQPEAANRGTSQALKVRHRAQGKAKVDG